MNEIKSLSIDIETYSSINLVKSGVYRYVESKDFEILLFAYSINNGEVVVIDLAQGEEIPKEIIDSLKNENIEKWAFNSNFERIAISKHLGYKTGEYLSPINWKCSRIWSASLGLPLSLEGVGAVLNLQNKKLKEGKNLIKYFCIPVKATKVNGGRTRNYYHHDLDKWEQFKEYNKRDVEVELAIKKKLEKFKVSDYIWNEYYLDQEINDKGIMLDKDLVTTAIWCDEKHRESNMLRAKEITKLDNPNSPIQLKEWLKEQGVEIETLSKDVVSELMDSVEDENVKELLKLRQELSKSSVKKYIAMNDVMNTDKRARGLFQFYGANRTGRFAGRLIQVQNLPQNHLDNLDGIRKLVKAKDYDTLEVLYDSTSSVLSEIIRTAFIPKANHKFVVADFSAIEARVIAWLACEKWRMDVFEKGGDIYCASASQMFKVEVIKNGINGHLRQKGKIAELACIAEGELVLTNKGLVPIESVKLEHKLWDGLNWVNHEGVIYKGEKEVIEYEGLKATKDHIVWVEGKKEPIQFGEAASSSSHLVQTGDGRRNIWLGKNNITRKEMEQKNESLLCSYKVYGMWRDNMEKQKQFNKWKIKGMSEMLTTKNCSRVAIQKIIYSKKECARKEKGMAINRGKTRVYDIRNAGSHNRFTVSNKLVHNCGYGGSVGALKSMGAIKMGLCEDELQGLINDWRSSNPNITKLWWDVDKAVKKCVKEKCMVKTHRLEFTYESGILFIKLPSGRKLSYIKPRIGENKFGGENVTYEGIGTMKKWERLESYGPKFVENIIQAISRDILMYSMINLKNKDYDIVMHVHDEVVLEVESEEVDVKKVCEIMSEVPLWADGLLLNAEGYACDFYKKD